jgi:PAS domain S-box-containing protein
MPPPNADGALVPPTEQKEERDGSHTMVLDTKQLEAAFLRANERLERMFDTVPLMMTIYEPDTKVLRVNRAFERLIGWSSDEIKDISLMEQCYPDPEYREQAREYMQACRPEWRDFRVRTRDGREVESSWTNIRLSDNTQLGIGIDITERNRAEAALRESEEVLRNVDRLKDEFSANLVHELRNSLSPMRNAVEMLRLDRSSHGMTEQAISTLDRQLDVMVRLVNDLMDTSRITGGTIALVRSLVDLDTVLRKAIESSRPQLQENDHRLIYEPPSGPALLVDGDPTRLEQVFANLLNNAAKFTPKGGVVTIEVERQGKNLAVRVRDTGIGIAPDVLPRIFDPFVQADRSVDRAHGGLGIGLSLVKHLIELHGGNVEAFSAGAGQGSEFLVLLPFLQRAPQEATTAKDLPALASRTETAKHQRRAVLVVDDNVDAAKTLAILLAAWGYEVLVAHDGQSGIELGKTRELHAIVMDLGMPGMSGYDAARLVRADPRLGRVLLIALTGWGQAQARSESLRAGFDHHLVKPVEVAVLREILASRTLLASTA